MKFSKEWNEYVIGFVLSTDDGRSINVQYEVNRTSNHPQPDMIAVIGAEGDETIDLFTDEEQEEIRAFIIDDYEINEIADAMTVIIYVDGGKDIWTEFYGVMSATDIIRLSNEIGG